MFSHCKLVKGVLHIASKSNILRATSTPQHSLFTAYSTHLEPNITYLLRTALTVYATTQCIYSVLHQGLDCTHLRNNTVYIQRIAFTFSTTLCICCLLHSPKARLFAAYCTHLQHVYLMRIALTYNTSVMRIALTYSTTIWCVLHSPTARLFNAYCTHVVYCVDEWVDAAVAHGQPVGAEPHDVDVLIPAVHEVIYKTRCWCTYTCSAWSHM